MIIFTKILSDNVANKKAQIGLDKSVSLTCTAVLCSILLSVVPFTVLFSVYFMIHSHCDGLYKKENWNFGICLWLHLFLFGWPHPEGLTGNVCQLILFIPEKTKQNNKKKRFKLWKSSIRLCFSNLTKETLTA